MLVIEFVCGYNTDEPKYKNCFRMLREVMNNDITDQANENLIFQTLVRILKIFTFVGKVNST